MSIKKSTVIAIVALFSLAPAQKVDANDLVKFFQGLGVDLTGSQSRESQIASQRADLESKIQFGLQSGQLTQPQAQELRWRAGQTRDSYQLASLRQEARGGRPQFGQTIRNWIGNLINRIEQGRSDGRLSINESSLFIDQLNGIRAHEARMSNSNGLSQKEYGQLMNRISRIDNLISSSLNSRKYTGGSRSTWY